MSAMVGAIAIPADVRSETLRDLFAYWDRARAGRSCPCRHDIDPIDLPPRLLPQMFVADVTGAVPDFRFRLAGTEVVRQAGLELTGRLLSELPLRGLEPIIAEYRAAVERCEPRHSTHSYVSAEGYTRVVERLVLPMSSTGAAVDMLVGAFEYRRNPADSAAIM